MGKLMYIRVTDECLPIFNINGTMNKVQKSKLLEQIYFQAIEPTPDQYVALVDMGFLWRLATPSAEDREKPDGTVFTWGDYAEKMLCIVLSRHPNSHKIVFVNDPYDLELNIKDSEHERRQMKPAYAEGSYNVYMQTQCKFPASRDFQNFFCNAGNKQRLQTFLQNEFSKRANKYPRTQFIYSVRNTCWNISTGERIEDFECEHYEADTILFYIYSQMLKAGLQDPVVIDAEDTDVNVLGAYVSQRTNGVLAIEWKKPFIKCQTLCPKEVADIFHDILTSEKCCPLLENTEFR